LSNVVSFSNFNFQSHKPKQKEVHRLNSDNLMKNCANERDTTTSCLWWPQQGGNDRDMDMWWRRKHPTILQWHRFSHSVFFLNFSNYLLCFLFLYFKIIVWLCYILISFSFTITDVVERSLFSSFLFYFMSDSVHWSVLWRWQNPAAAANIITTLARYIWRDCRTSLHMGKLLFLFTLFALSSFKKGRIQHVLISIW